MDENAVGEPCEAQWIGIAGRHVDDWYRGFFFPYPPRNLPLARLAAQVHVGDQCLIIFANPLFACEIPTNLPHNSKSSKLLCTL